MIRFNSQKLACVAQAASSEEARYYLCGVRFEDGLAIATNGHVLTVAKDDDAPKGQTGLLPVSPKAITALKKKAADRAVFDAGVLTVCDISGQVLYIEPSVEIDATFPDWRRVVPGEIGGATDAAFAYGVLKILCDTRKILGAELGLRLTGSDQYAPHTVTYDGVDDVVSVAMPIRASDAIYPDWLSARAEKVAA